MPKPMPEQMHSGPIIYPDWPAPARIKAVCSTRQGGCSQGVFSSLNLGQHVGDDAAAVIRNRQIYSAAAALPSEAHYLQQIHSTQVVELRADLPAASAGELCADAAFTRQTAAVCTVMTADCLPLLICNSSGSAVAAVHAGWRGLCAGVIENTLACFSPSDTLMVWLGPAISQQAFEVGSEVRQAFISRYQSASQAFVSAGNDKWYADLYLLARQRLQLNGVTQIYGGQYCTFGQPELFFSYRRDGQTGRMACSIWIE